MISSNLLRRDDPLEEQLDGAAVCREQADMRAASLSSSAVAMEMVVSWGVNFSVTAVKWTATRARGHVSFYQLEIEAQRTFEQSRCPLGYVCDQDLPTTIQHEAVQRRGLFELGDGAAGLCCTAGAPGEHLDGVAGDVLEQEPNHDISISIE